MDVNHRGERMALMSVKYGILTHLPTFRHFWTTLSLESRKKGVGPFEVVSWIADYQFPE